MKPTSECPFCSIYAYTIIRNYAPLYMPIFASQKKQLCVCLCYGLYVCFHIYAHITVCKGTHLQNHICGPQKNSNVYVSVSVSKDALV